MRRLVVDFHGGRAADADLAHLPGDERGVRRHAAARGENAFGGDHAAEILGRRLDAHEQHLLALFRRGHRAIGVQIDPAGRRAGTGGQAGGDHRRLGHLRGIEHRRQELFELVGGIAHDRRLPVDQLLLVHVHRELERGHRGALAVPRLQHVDDAVFDRELEVLHVLEVPLERLADALELVVRLRHLLLQLGHRLGRAHAGDHVLALRVDQELAVELLGAVGRIARERDAGPGVVAGVPVDHRLHVDRGAPLGRDVVLAPVDDGAVVHPRSEHGADGAHQLIPGRGREVLAGALLDERLEADDELLEILDRELGVLDVLVVALVLELLDDHLERLVILVRPLLHAEHDVAVHLHEAAVAVPREARVVRLLRERFDRLVVEPEVEDGVHHPRHRVARAGADRHEQRVLEVAELLLRSASRSRRRRPSSAPAAPTDSCACGRSSRCRPRS